MADVFIDKSMIVKLVTDLFLTIAGTNYTLVPLGGVDPDSPEVEIRLVACDLVSRRRCRNDENHLADVKVVVVVIVSEARIETDQATMDGACSKVEQAMSMKYTTDAGTTHELHLDEAIIQEAQVPDEQRRIRAATVTISGWCRRESGSSIAHS